MRFTSIPIRNIIREAVARGGIIVDVRSREEFLEGHIPMAINIPFEQIEDREYTLPRSKYLLVYCAHGVRSMKAALIMSEDGYRVINTIGGLAQYRGPLTRQR
mgnify:CR=1 FL=1